MKHITDKQLDNIIAETQATGGSTFEGFEVVHHSTGYQVATTNNTTGLTDREAIRAAIEATDGNGGTWMSPAGELFIDKSIHIADMGRALELGHFYKQQEIWDHANMAGIKC